MKPIIDKEIHNIVPVQVLNKLPVDLRGKTSIRKFSKISEKLFYHIDLKNV